MAENSTSIYTLNFEPGIQRDGPRLSHSNWTDGQWCRFYRGRPKKMGGYRLVTNYERIQRGATVIPNSTTFNVYSGDADTLNYFTMDYSGNLIGAPSDARTPAAFLGTPSNQWKFDVMFDTNSNSSVLLAFAAPNVNAIDSQIQRPVYSGDIFSTAPLTPIGQSVSGGMCVLQPYLFLLDNSGYIQISAANQPTNIVNTARIAPYKLVAALPTRGGNTSPAGLIWSLDRLIRVTQVGTETAAEFSFDTVAGESSILSSSAIIEYDGLYYWPGVDRFLVYNGTVAELPNDMSLEYFFTHLNYAQRQKVWATKVTLWGEIWWHYPADDSVECNESLIYNVREKVWYDTGIARSCGYYNQVFTRPLWFDNVPDDNTGRYDVWMHEIGTDQNRFGTLSPIPSSITSPPVSWATNAPSGQSVDLDRWVYLSRLEPDFNQTGDMTLTVTGRQYANAPDSTPVIYPFGEDTTVITPRIQKRQMTLTFESNVVGGDYEMGANLITVGVGDGRQTTPPPITPSGPENGP